MATIIWTGEIQGNTMRVVDAGAGNNPRLTVELRGGADAMGVVGWNRYDPMPTSVFEAILISAHVIT